MHIVLPLKGSPSLSLANNLTKEISKAIQKSMFPCFTKLVRGPVAYI